MIMFLDEIAIKRQSCRSYDKGRQIEKEKLDSVLEAARLAPSACNGQPYIITVCTGDKAKEVAKACQGMGMNKFASDAPVLLVISEDKYVKTAKLGSRVTGIDYRSIDIGILAAYITAEAESRGLSSCILGWLDDGRIREICKNEGATRLVITLGYASEGEFLREKKRKDADALFRYID